jgi:peptidoglycan/LPS O-acetylase OafA/YrhL
MESALAHPHRPETAVRHDIPSLDGLRALAIAIVILSHTSSLLPAKLVSSGLYRYLIGGGLHGVQVFFVISGFLITTLLLREFQLMRDISLRRFYARRTLRIFPPFYVYLAVLLLLWITGLHPQDLSTFVSAATYTITYHPHPQGWLLQHAWSLSIEEQFYLLWPAILLATIRRGIATRLAIIVLLSMPIVRAILFVAFGHDQRLIVNCSSVDMLIAGCLLALAAENRDWQRWNRRWITAWSAAGLAALGLVIAPYADAKLVRTPLAVVCVALTYSITALAIAAGLQYVVRDPKSIAGKVLNLRLVRHLGVISYSIYLWQQLFTENPASFGVLTYALILIAAELSFWLIERPIMQLRAHLAL